VNNDFTIFAVDDNVAVLESLLTLCKSQDWNVKTYTSSLRFLLDYDPAIPGCLIIEAMMPEMNGLEILERLRAKGNWIPVIFLSDRSNVSIAVSAMKSGAIDFFEKPFQNDRLITRIQHAQILTATQRQIQADQDQFRQSILALTDRERQVLDLIVDGKGTKEIAHKLNISTKTVHFHRIHLMEKLKVETIAKLVQVIIKHSGTQLDKI